MTVADTLVFYTLQALRVVMLDTCDAMRDAQIFLRHPVVVVSHFHEFHKMSAKTKIENIISE